MTLEAFDALLARRDELARKHEMACAILAEEPRVREHDQRCTRLYAELEELEAQIDASLEAERAEQA